MSALIVLSSAASAHAGSIDAVTTGKDRSVSIERIRCEKCVRKMEEKKAASVVELAPGTQKVEIRDVDGVRKVFRTEAWMGGSPVVYVSKAIGGETPAVSDTKLVEPAEDVAERPAVVTKPLPAQSEANMIDEKSKTSAVTADMGADGKVEIKPRPFDPSKLELRVN